MTTQPRLRPDSEVAEVEPGNLQCVEAQRLLCRAAAGTLRLVDPATCAYQLGPQAAEAMMLAGRALSIVQRDQSFRLLPLPAAQATAADVEGELEPLDSARPRTVQRGRAPTASRGSPRRPTTRYQDSDAGSRAGPVGGEAFARGPADSMETADRELIAQLELAIGRLSSPARPAARPSHGRRETRALPGSSLVSPATEAKRLNLAIASLGVVKAKVEGVPVKLPFAKTGELLVWLAREGPSTRDRIVDAIWGSSREPSHVAYFKVSVRRLRGALAEHPCVNFNPIPFEDGLYRLSEAFEVELDVDELARGSRSSDPRVLERLLCSYQGDFLPRADSQWASTIRLGAVEDAFAAAMSLGSALAQEAPLGAAAAYRRAVDLDPLASEGHLALIRAYSSLSDWPRARRAYRAYEFMLANELGLSLEPASSRLIPAHAQLEWPAPA